MLAMKKILFLLCLVPLLGRGQIITTIAGGGSGMGEGVQATATALVCPEDMQFDKFGNLYFTEALSHRVRKIDTAGVIKTVAGTGVGGFSGDGGSATAAKVKQPSGITVDTFGNVFFCDQVNNRIRKIDVVTSLISTVAGNGTAVFGGDGIQATATSLYSPYGVYYDKTSGGLYIADIGNHKVRFVNASGIITTVAGNGLMSSLGDGGPATSASCCPISMCKDLLGNIYISDGCNRTVRKINLAGIISTVAGVDSCYTYNGDGTATSACMDPIYIKANASGILYIPDAYNNRLRKVDLTGQIRTVAGTGVAGVTGDGGLATLAQMHGPSSVAFDKCGNVYVAHVSGPARIRKITIDSTCSKGTTDTTNHHVGIATVSKGLGIGFYPNPVYSTLHIDAATAGVQYIILSVAGAVAQSGGLHQGGNDIPVGSLPGGIYVLQLVGADGSREMYRVVKE